MAYTDIDKPEDYFNTKLYTGNGGTQSITGVGFQPDWVWVKQRSSTRGHRLFDVVRGDYNLLESNSTNAEANNTNQISLDADGFSTGSSVNTNSNGATYVGWNWLAGGTASSNTDGSITSTVSANQTSGFSVVTTTGTGSNATIGHGLGAVPAMIIGKRRDSGSSEWRIYNKNLSSNSHILFLNNTNAEQSGNSATWNNTAPTSSVFSVGSSGDVNASSGTFVFYCFVEKKGFSKFGSYKGNGSSNGAFIFTGFKPAWVIAKKTNGTGSWRMWDNKREGYNGDNAFLYANLSNAEESDGTLVDFCSQGFKWRGSSQDMNGSGGSYIFMAFAENPFVTSTGIAGTAR